MGEGLRRAAGQGDGAASEYQATGLIHVEGQAFVDRYAVEGQRVAGQVTGEGDSLAAGTVVGRNGDGLAEAHPIAGIDGGSVAAVGDVDGIAGDRDICSCRSASVAIGQGKADRCIAGWGITAISNALDNVIDQCAGRRCASAGKGDAQYTISVGEGREGLTAGLQIATANRKQCP